MASHVGGGSREERVERRPPEREGVTLRRRATRGRVKRGESGEETAGARREKEFFSSLYFLLSPRSCSIFGGEAAKNRGERIRTSDLLTPSPFLGF
jgi:hypothetical protein